MEHISPISHRLSAVPANGLPARGGQALSLVQSRLRLAQPDQAAPQDWQTGTAGLLEWLGIDVAFAPAARTRRLPRMADWGRASPGVPVFAPWTGWSPAAFQHGGLPGLPAAHYVASYLVDHARGSLVNHDGIDMVLMSPHPALCAAEDAGGVPLPRAGLLPDMIGAARAEGREKLAIILHARQRNAIAAQLLAAGKGLPREGLAIDILTIEDALPVLMAGRSPWDAIIAMPDLRSTVFTMLGHASGVLKAWPMVWVGRGLQLVTSEAAGEGASRLPLDAQGLIHALALTLHHAGAARAAWRLHDAWARLRDSGVTTTGRGGDAPYSSTVSDTEFLTMVQRDAAANRRPQKGWRPLQNAQSAMSGSQIPILRVVTSGNSVSAT